VKADRACAFCGSSFRPSRSDAIFCPYCSRRRPWRPTTPAWTRLDRLDGPLLVASIEERIQHPKLSERDRRALDRWRAGGMAKLDTADRVLVGLGMFLRELPDAVWIERGSR